MTHKTWKKNACDHCNQRTFIRQTCSMYEINSCTVLLLYGKWHFLVDLASCHKDVTPLSKPEKLCGYIPTHGVKISNNSAFSSHWRALFSFLLIAKTNCCLSLILHNSITTSMSFSNNCWDKCSYIWSSYINSLSNIFRRNVLPHFAFLLNSHVYHLLSSFSHMQYRYILYFIS